MKNAETNVENSKNNETKKQQLSVEALLLKRSHNNALLAKWKKKVESAQKKVRKYRGNKKKYSKEIHTLVHQQ